jgi:hypothetical protein
MMKYGSYGAAAIAGACADDDNASLLRVSHLRVLKSHMGRLVQSKLEIRSIELSFDPNRKEKNDLFDLYDWYTILGKDELR